MGPSRSRDGRAKQGCFVRTVQGRIHSGPERDLEDPKVIGFLCHSRQSLLLLPIRYGTRRLNRLMSEFPDNPRSVSTRREDQLLANSLHKCSFPRPRRHVCRMLSEVVTLYGKPPYCLNFVVIRSTASFTSAPALSICALNCAHAVSLAPFSL